MTNENGRGRPAVTRRHVPGIGGAVTGTVLMAGLPRAATASDPVQANVEARTASVLDAPVDVTLRDYSITLDKVLAGLPAQV
jgi:hypothetical protein